MRLLLTLPLLMVAACTVENDPQNNHVSLDYDAEQIENTADSLGNAAGDAATQVGNAAERAGRAIENEIGDLDVDVDVRRNRDGNAQ